ncbi:MAG: helix-turn-helix domain-containing protein [Christensenellales bacterium]
MELKIFAERLTDLIFDSKKVARDIAREIGIGKTTIYEYLSGNKMPTLNNLIKIADYFNCSTI